MTDQKTIVRASKPMAVKAYEEIRRQIISLDLAPGSAIDEDSLIDDLQIGRTPLREAVKRLEIESLIEVYPRRGTFVSDVHITDLSAISEVRATLEGQAAALAAARMPADLLPALAELTDLARRRDMDLEEIMELDADVHSLIYTAAGNRYLEDMLIRLLGLSQRIWNVARSRLPSMGRDVWAHHALLEALALGDAEESQRLADQHVTMFERRMRSVL